jgi:hypothetical protein
LPIFLTWPHTKQQSILLQLEQRLVRAVPE